MAKPEFMKLARHLIAQGMPTPTAKRVASGKLPMDESSRMARAAEDWDIDQVMAHGTNAPDVDEFKISRGKLGEGVYFYPQADAERAGKRAIATRYRKKGVDQSNVIQAVPRKGLKFKEIPFNEAKLDPDLHKKYADYDGIKWLNENGTPREIVIFDPKNVRSINAAFDPEMKQSGKILAGTVAGATALGSNDEAEAMPISPVIKAAKSAKEPVEDTLQELLDAYSDLGTGAAKVTKPQIIEEAAKQAITKKDNVWDEFLPRAEDMAETGYKSKSFVVEYPIDDFLRLADVGKDAEKAKRVSGFDKFETYPQLTIDTMKTGVAKVVGHEGRHRARELKKRGYTTMPVEFRSVENGNPIRWSEQGDPKNYDYEELFPEGLIGQDKSLARKERDAVRPFPIKRGDYGIIKATVPMAAIGASTQAESAPLSPQISPIVKSAMDQMVDRRRQLIAIGQKEADKLNQNITSTAKKYDARSGLAKADQTLANESEELATHMTNLRGAIGEGSDRKALSVIEQVRSRFGLAAPATLMTTAPEAKLMGEPVPETNTQALLTGAKRGFDQTMSNEGWLLGLASALGAEGANELRAKLAEQRNPAMGAQDNELMRTIGEILGSMSPGAL